MNEWMNEWMNAHHHIYQIQFNGLLRVKRPKNVEYQL